ncbi:hypothetical protein [Streptomyces scopuliridis]|uniref:hypothetical protein n=1 Tax=Streptomyces scopuliridis TaxID=452529 RepID=UPI003417FEAB
MRKRVSRPARFAAVDNEAIDTLPSILAIGLLTRLIRAKDGDDVTVESLSQNYDEGEKALSKAMRMLVDNANVVKFKIQRATTEAVIEGGEEVVKRGGSWYTTFSVDSLPFTAEDVTVMLEAIYAEGNVKCHRVEPTRLDPRGRPPLPAPRPTPPLGGVGATGGNDAKPQDRPTPPSPGVGQGGAHIRKETTSADTHDEDEDDAPSGRSPVDVRRTSSTGSNAREVEGGVAASSKTSPPDHQHDDTRPPGNEKSSSKGKARHTRAQLDQVRAVRAFFPADFLTGLPDVPELSQAILDALAGDVPAADRTVAQLGARIEERWNHHGWAVKFYAGQIQSPVGAAVAMVRPLARGDRYGCANPRCDAGFDVDTGAECMTCPERIEAHKAERRQQARCAAVGTNAGSVDPSNVLRAMPAQRATVVIDSQMPFRECACRNLILPKTSTDTMCQECRKEADHASDYAVNAPF